MMQRHYTKQLKELADGLIERGIPFQFKYMPCMNGGQIVGDGWDAICHDGSYGHEDGLLEIMGKLVNKSKANINMKDVEGYLTAQEILDRIDHRYPVKRKRG